MDVGIVKVAEDKDFERLKQFLDNHDGWKMEYTKDETKVWAKSVQDTNFKMIKLWTVFEDVTPEQMYDVLHDPEYRKVWDQNMIDSHDIGFINPNNDVGYYAMSCPAPLKNRDFVLQRSWLDTGQEQLIINHSVYHKDYPPRSGFVRATSFLTGFLIRPGTESGCRLGYVSQTDPQGALPHWLVNKCTQIFAPKMVKRLRKASQAYVEWKKDNNPGFKPWHYPEQIKAPRIRIEDCVLPSSYTSVKYLDSNGHDDQIVACDEESD